MGLWIKSEEEKRRGGEIVEVESMDQAKIKDKSPPYAEPFEATSCYAMEHSTEHPCNAGQSNTSLDRKSVV